MKKRLLILALIVLSSISYADDNNLKQLKDQGIMSEEEYLILNDSYEEDGKQLYNLLINGESKNKVYPIYVEKGDVFFPIFSFFDTLKFTNYEYDKEKGNLKILLGDSLEEVSIDINKKTVIKDFEQLNLSDKDVLVKGNEIYLYEEVFKKVFLNNLNISKEKQKVNMTLSFASPEEILIRLQNNERLLKENSAINDITFTNKNSKFFELGYLRTEVNQLFTKDKSENDGKFESDWEADFEYQGAVLFGELTAEYDAKEHMFEDVKLRYDDIWNEHTFEIENHKYNEGGAREWELSFRKDKGYYVTGSKSYIIRESVPIGSRVELVYMGTIIDIQNAENGNVVFTNTEIKEDREYTLKVYTQDGKIFTKTINTTSDYNQQNKGEVEYDFNLRENHEIARPSIDSSVYYGLTNNLTMGLGYMREPELINDEYEYLNKGRGELIYSNTVYSLPYTFRVGGDKVFEDYTYSVNEKSTKDDYSYDFLGQIDIKKLRLRAEQINKGEFYEDKREQNFYARFSPIRELDLTYEHERTEKHPDMYGVSETEKDNIYTVEFSKSLRNMLFTAEYEKSDLDGTTYGANIYYTGWRTVTAKLENEWKNDGKDYEVAFSVFSNGNRYFDYNLEARYSEEFKDRFTFRFEMNYDNWLNFESFIDKKGNQDYKIGIDRITDLKNPTKKVKSMESSPVKVLTFLDLNDNNKYDKDEGEYGVSKVDVTIGDQTVTTDKKGVAKFYGVPNEILYELNPTIQKPNFLLGSNKIQIKGKNTSTIEAFIPIKPMVSLTGIVKIDDILKLSNIQKARMYDDILVKIKDANGKVLDMAIPDETGVFEVSGLLPQKYMIEVNYMGIDYQIKGINEIIKLEYIEKRNAGNTVVFNIAGNKISMKKGDELAHVDY